MYKAIRARDPSGKSQCSVDLIQFVGQVFIMNTTTAFSSTNTSSSAYNASYVRPTMSGPYAIELLDGFTTEAVTSYYYFSDQATPTVTSVYPKTGHFLGGYNITITGTNLHGYYSHRVYLATVPC